MNTFLPQTADGETQVSTISKNASSPQTTTRTACGFFFYHSWLDDISALPLDTQREVIFAIAQYAAAKTLPAELSPAASVAFKFCKRIIDYDLERRQDSEKRNKKQGKSSPKSTAKKSPQPADSYSLQPTSAPPAQNDRLSPQNTIPSASPSAPTFSAQLPDSHSLQPTSAPSAQNSTTQTPLPTPQPTDTHPLHPNASSPYYNQESRIENQELKINNPLSPEKKEKDSSFSQLSNETNFAAPTPQPLAEPIPTSKSSKNSRPTNLDEVATYWREENLKSSAQEFFDYYQSTHWRNKQGESLRSWKLAAKNWERYFLTNILPLRQKAEAANLSLKLTEENAATALQERERQRQTLESDFDEWKRRAVSPEEGRRAYQLALEETRGDALAAIELLKRRRRN